MDDVITLYRIEGDATDAVGNQTLKQTPREVYAQIKGVKRSEFFGAAQNKLKPEMVVEICLFDYEGEREADYKKVRYAIYRTFPLADSDRIELYLTERSGVYGSKNR